MGTIKFQYKQQNNPEGRGILGVPLADLTDEEFDGLPEHLQQTVRATPFYVEVTGEKVAVKIEKRRSPEIPGDAAAEE